MRRSLLGLLTILAMASLLTVGCERVNTLRIVAAGTGKEVMSDIADWYQYFDKDDSVWMSVYTIQPDTLEFEAQYVEIGLGLPTWTPYQASITKATINYKSADGTVIYDPVTMPMTVAVPVDQTGKKTTNFSMTLLPAWWKEKYFGDDVAEPPDLDLLDHIEATIKFSAFDSVSGRTIEAKSMVAIEIGNLYDDEKTVGK